MPSFREPSPPPRRAFRFGVAAFDTVDPLALAPQLAAAGCDYVEPALAKLAALPHDQLEWARDRLREVGLVAEAMNWFLPPDLKVTGPAVDEARVADYVARAFAVAQTFGTEVVVFGSPASRSFPMGFPPERARAQLVAFLRLCADTIEREGHTLRLGLEALRRQESNLVNTTAEALAVVREVARPSVRLTIDFYHLSCEQEDPAVLRAVGDGIVHVQVAEPRGRVFPREQGADVRFTPFFAALQAAGYRGRISVEAVCADVVAEVPRAFTFLRELTARAGTAG